ncbi:ABC transporter permease [Dethiobacter alkaliphilus]|uniref:ABC transporter permease n=1 Tax=Dethiobacter alkaliphilus TaxID=427926 RepID=UPI0022263469|nr:FtsX-like permease family protein [Dethiobacter alkaliphilus]MCW3491394.1 ABC transporter permease [Dethiobacter alkaliphilus]
MQLYHIAINNLRRRKAKMVFVLLGLVIGIATMVSVYSVVETMQVEMTRQVSEFGANVVITPDAGELTFSYGGITLPAAMFDVEVLTLEDVEAIDGVSSREMLRAVAPKLLGVATTEAEQNLIVVGANLQQEFMVKPWLRLRSEDEMMEDATEVMVGEDGEEMEFERLNLAREDLDRLVLSDSELMLGSTLAANLGVMEGDYLTLSGTEFQVFAVLEDSGSAEDEQIFMNISAAQSLLERPGEVTLIELAADYTLGSEEALLSQLNDALPHAEITSLRQEALRRDEMLTRLVRFGMSVSVLILLVGLLVVALTMSGAVRERTREIGVFRAIGFRKSHVTKIILLEGVLISVVGGILGYLAGMSVARYAGPLMANMDIQVPWRLDMFLLAIVLAVVIGLLASIYPARQASQLDPVEALRFI